MLEQMEEELTNFGTFEDADTLITMYMHRGPESSDEVKQFLTDFASVLNKCEEDTKPRWLLVDSSALTFSDCLYLMEDYFTKKWTMF